MLNNIDDIKVDEFAALKQQAKALGIRFSNNISLEVLRAKVSQQLLGDADEAERLSEAEAHRRDVDRIQKEAFALVRVQISNMNPAKANVPGEVISIANRYIGTLKRYVPYTTDEDGFHLERALVDFLKDRKFLQLSEKRDSLNRPSISQKELPEFSIVELPQHTPEDFAKMAAAQAAAGEAFA